VEDAYSDYKYKRYKPRRRSRVFIFVLFVAIIGVLFFVGNLIFGFVSFGRISNPTTVNLESHTFYVSVVSQNRNKSDAMNAATLARRNGAAGYLFNDGTTWNVVDHICHSPFPGATAITSQAATISLLDTEHHDFIQKLVLTFRSTFEALCGFLHDFNSGSKSRQEVSGMARLAYNNLSDLNGEFRLLKTEGTSAQYNALQAKLSRMLFGLAVLWLDPVENFASTIRNSAAWIAFSYFELCLTIFGNM